MIKLFKIIGALVLLAAVSLIGCQATQAYQIEYLDGVALSNDYVISPGKVEVPLNPGETAVRQLKVVNRYNREVKFKIEIEDFKGSRQPGENVVLLGQDKGPYSLKDFIQPETLSFTLKPKERIILPIIISIPADAQPGGLYGAVIVSTEPNSESERVAANQSKGNLTIVSRVASLFFVRVNGPVNENGSLTEFSVNRQVFADKQPVNFKVLYENKGNVYLNPYGYIEIKNLLGSTVARLNIDPYFVMPEAVRLREISWEKGAMFGPYQAKIFLNRGYGDIVDEQSLIFWVLPWQTALIFLGAALGVMLVLWLLWRWLSKNFEIKRK